MPVLVPAIEAPCPHIGPAAWMQAIVRVESGGNPLAINVNGSQRLARQPRSMPEAVATARWLQANGYNFDAGIAQINVANFSRFGLTADTAFDVCRNLQAAGRLFNADYAVAYRQTHNAVQAVQDALSMYNTGNKSRGYTNGYVHRVIVAATTGTQSPIPLQKKESNPIPPQPASSRAEERSTNPQDVFNERNPKMVY